MVVLGPWDQKFYPAAMHAGRQQAQYTNNIIDDIPKQNTNLSLGSIAELI